MTRDNYLPIWEGLGEFSVGLYKEVTPPDRDVKNRKTKRAGTDTIVLTAIAYAIEQFEGYRRKNLTNSLAYVLTGNAHCSIATSQMFEIVIPALTNSLLDSNDKKSFLRSVYESLEQTDSQLMGHFYNNAIFLVRNYYLADNGWLSKWITDIAEITIQQNKKDGLFSKMLTAILTDTVHDEILSNSLNIIAKQDKYLSLYWEAVKILLLSNNKDKLITATMFIVKDDRYLTVKPLRNIDNLALDGQKVINNLTWDYNRQTGYFLETKSDVEFFCVLTSAKPRHQLLNAWKQFQLEPGRELNQKGLRLLSKRADKKLPRKKGDDISVEVTVENFHKRFPLIVI